MKIPIFFFLYVHISQFWKKNVLNYVERLHSVVPTVPWDETLSTNKMRYDFLFTNIKLPHYKRLLQYRLVMIDQLYEHRNEWTRWSASNKLIKNVHWYRRSVLMSVNALIFFAMDIRWGSYRPTSTCLLTPFTIIINISSSVGRFTLFYFIYTHTACWSL